ncbi:hypothetical protein UNSWCS_665 [Campylobacter concisus UNSWCS]|uniref:Uncharacterized protein n=1 Tax=Campylobacter concisus UNSWCS TaxID=1242968 RepID=U2F1T9_9BACT|nr:hypothetical protein UNSWCS_665 [Campylobacter concisus UNSWCS]
MLPYKGQEPKVSHRAFKEHICSIIKESIDTKLGKSGLLWHGAK